jgi:hypothetical protein
MSRNGSRISSGRNTLSYKKSINKKGLWHGIPPGLVIAGVLVLFLAVLVVVALERVPLSTHQKTRTRV